MTIQLPEFVTSDFLLDILKKNLPSVNEVKVEHFWGEWATKPGDNYASVMYRIHVDFEVNDSKRRKSIILKVKLIKFHNN